MVHFSDDLFLGGTSGGPDAISFLPTAADNPTQQFGVGPLGRITFLDQVPLTLAVANVAALQAQTLNVPMTLAAGTGITKGLAPDGTGVAVYIFDCPRSVSLTSLSNQAAINYLVTGYDQYNIKMTQLMAGPNNSTVNSKKAFMSIASVVPQSTSVNTVSVGTSDIFGLPFRCIDAGYIVAAKWAGVLAQNAGTLTVADTTSPATNATGDVRGTYAQSGASSNGVLRLVVGQALAANQAGSTAFQSNAIGVLQA